MSGYKGLNNPNASDMLKNHMNAITNVSMSSRLYGKLFAIQDIAKFINSELENKTFTLKRLHTFLKEEIDDTHRLIDKCENNIYGLTKKK